VPPQGIAKLIAANECDRADKDLHNREATFHDAWASTTKLEDILVKECFEAPTALENQFILRKMGNLARKRLLDIGAGLGESSVYFALHGAQVTTTDISPLMVEKVLQLGAKYGVEIDGIVSTVESLNVPENRFDFVYIANTIHHVHDRSQLFAQIHRALKPGGLFFSYDPLAYNPAINLYRRIATKVRTPDERPLTRADLRLARTYFDNVGHREYWIATLLLFVKYYAVDRVHPNEDRYWKRILKEKPEDLRWWQPLLYLDSVLLRIPGVQWLAWNTVLWGNKPGTPAT
jgi:2-polyprenyl-3-methyl-5-hydroxy-6-metoxy-1,4-benzoquinol methylase